MRALPAKEEEILKLPREYIGNLIYTIVGEPFQEWVKDRVEQRNAKLKKEQKQDIEMDPEVLRIFQNSTSVGCK